MKLRIAWKIVLQGSWSNHRDGTKIKARKRALGWHINSLKRGSWPNAEEFSDLVRYACRTGQGKLFEENSK